MRRSDEQLSGGPAEDEIVVFCGHLLADVADSDASPGWLRIRRGRIADVVRTIDRPAGWPDDAAERLLPHSYVLPGLIDAHVHLCYPDAPRARSNAGAALRAGVTTVRDCGGPADVILPLAADSVRDPSLPRIVACGPPLTQPRGHCWQFGGEVGSPQRLRSLVAALWRDGARFVKVIASGGGTVGTHPWEPSFERKMLRTAVRAAAAHGVPMTSHCLSGEAIARVLDAGGRQIEHGKFRDEADRGHAYDPRVVDRMVACGATVCPTLSVGHFVLRDGAAADVEIWQPRVEYDLEHLSRTVKAGVALVAGTDAGWRQTPFDALHDELLLMTSAGVSHANALVAATSGAARALDLEHEIGTLRAGASADLIAVDEDPRHRLETLRRPRLVMKAGDVQAAAAAGAAA